MKRTIAIISGITFICLFALITVQLAPLYQPQTEELFVFDSSRHTVHSLPYHANEIRPASFEDFDAIRHPRRAIVVGEVVGPSINRIINLSDDLRDVNVATGFNHVVTPVLVHYVIFAGEYIEKIEIGQVINVREAYYVVTADTQAYARGFPTGDVMTILSSWPMEMGNRYLIYLHYNDLDVYRFNGEVVLSAMRRESIYLLDPSEEARARMYVPSRPHFIEWWDAAMQTHGHLADLPWVERS